MSARRGFGIAALVLAAGLAAAFVVAALHRPAQPRVLLPGPPVAVLHSLSPAEPQFGDRVVATVDVFVDPRRVDPRAVRLDAGFAPLTLVSSARSMRTSRGIAIVHVVDTLQCVDAACVPSLRPTAFRLPRLRIVYPHGQLLADWQPVRVHGRLAAADMAHPMLRVAAPQAHTGYRLPPDATGWTLLGAALALAVAGLALLVRAALRSLALARRPRGTPVERLLAELAQANGHSRAVLERLARELEPLDPPLSFESRVLAWAPREPEPGAVAELARRIREAVAR